MLYEQGRVGDNRVSVDASGTGGLCSLCTFMNEDFDLRHRLRSFDLVDIQISNVDFIDSEK